MVMAVLLSINNEGAIREKRPLQLVQTALLALLERP